jgi:hypothetical protein
MKSTELDLPVAVALAAAPLNLVDKTVGQVIDAIGRHLRRAELEPEWILAANWVGDANDSMVGLKANAPWPASPGNDNQRRFCLSVETGHSEGWRVQVDHVCLHKAGDSGHWSSVPLVRIKTLTRSHAWAVAAAVSRLLDID